MKGNAMSQILTQLEKADDILLAREDPDMKVIKPIPDGEVHEKPEHGVPELLPYVWSM
jgi:hypothetical protein